MWFEPLKKRQMHLSQKPLKKGKENFRDQPLKKKVRQTHATNLCEKRQTNMTSVAIAFEKKAK